MTEIEDESVHLICTSPPYNAGIIYDVHDDNMPLDDYLAMLDVVWRECYRVLVPGGRIAVNVANQGRCPHIPLNAIIGQQLRDAGLDMNGEIIWDKAASVGPSTAWGSYCRASKPCLRDVHEYILVLSKGDVPLQSEGTESGIRPEEFIEWTKSIWRIMSASASAARHPAPYPVELPRRLILLYTNIGDTVLDPFMGSGTTAWAAKLEGRHYLGYDISENYCEMARRRVSQELLWGGNDE
jgi:site-specific DNA-methyltransferase (adenine-specific)